MAGTNWIPSQRSGRASMLGAGFGSGVGQGLETIIQNMAQQKAEKIRAGHLKTLSPGLSDAEANALSGLGSSVYEPALRGGFGQQQPEPQQLQGMNGPAGISGSSAHNNIKPIDFLKALAPLGLQMSPEQEKQISALPEEQQDRIADQVFRSLCPQQKDQLQNHWLAQQQLPQQNKSSMGQNQAQQVIGSPQPGVSSPQPNRVSLSQALQGDSQNFSSAENKRQQDLNLKIEATNEIEDSLKDIEELVNSGDIQTGFIAQKAAEAGFLSQLTPDTAQLYQAMQDLLVKQQVAASMGGRGSNEFRKTIASAKLNLAQPLPVIKKTLEKIKKANVQYRKSLETIRSGGQIEERSPLQSKSTSKPSNVVKSLDQAKVKDGARAKNLDTGEWFVFKNGNWETE